MKRVFIIENPAASRSTPQGLRIVEDALGSAGYGVESRRTEGPGAATRLAADAAAAGFDIIAVYGGDGTVMQAVEGMRDSGAVLGLIPGGTSNLLASNLRIPRDPRQAARIIASGAARTIDLVRLKTSEGTRFYSVGAGTGYDADMMAETTTEQKKRWGVFAYVAFVLRTAHRIRPRALTVTVDGASGEYEAASVIVANCAEILPPILKLGADVTIDDGVLDVILLKADGFFGAAIAVWNLLRLRETSRVQRIRGREVTIETAEPQVVQADGDICGTTPFTATMIKGGLTVIAPVVGRSGS